MTDLLKDLWYSLDGDASLSEGVSFVGPQQVLPSVFDVTGLAVAAVGVACLAAAELLGERSGRAVPSVEIESRSACAAFLCERLFSPLGWELPALWDPIAGDYETADGWIRLHTNYSAHRSAALRALRLTEPDRDGVAAAVRAWKGDELEERVVHKGGCAAVMRSGDEWVAHPHGAAVAAEPAVAMRWCAETEVPPLGTGDQPLAGIRVLDLTRVIAGPVCTRFLAAYGADVLRIDPPRFAEVPALVPETSAGKHTATLDLTARDGHVQFEDLLRQADVVVCGLRPGALRRLDLDPAWMRTVNPALIVAELDAYGWTGPWAGRRGFDSLVQMSSGIASTGGIATGTDQPVPLPAQALDHATGFVLAGAICRAITRRQRTNAPSEITAALIGTANLLVGLDDPAGLEQPAPVWLDTDTEARATAWGAARAVPIPGEIHGVRPVLRVEPGPLGRHAPAFTG